MRELVTKWYPLRPNQIREAFLRLDEMRRLQPPNLSRVLHWGFVEGALSVRSGFLEGTPLHRLVIPEKSDMTSLYVSLRDTLTAWDSLGFVHGDLNARNILARSLRGEIMLTGIIDPVILLSSPQTTPRFYSDAITPSKVLRSPSFDRRATRKILEACRVNWSIGPVDEHDQL